MAKLLRQKKQLRGMLAGTVLILALSAPLAAAPPKPSPSPSASASARPKAAAAATVDTSKPLTLKSLIEIIDGGKNLIDERTHAEQLLKADPKDYKAHFLLGYIMHRAEGDLPRARYHLQKANKIALRSARKGDKEAQHLYFAVSVELAEVLGEMDQYSAKIRILREMSSYTRDNTEFTAQMAWPLMKLNKEKAARQAIQKSLSNDDVSVQTTALNTLGALESYLGHHQAAYDAGKKLLEKAKGKDKPNLITYYSNMGLNCLPLGYYEEAEKHFLQAADRPFSDHAYTNPHTHLCWLYLSQARFSETINSLRKAERWSRATKPFLYQQSIAGITELQGTVYLELGLPEKAVQTLSWLVQRPDRRGTNSTHVDQTEAGNLLTWRTALYANLQRNRERLAATDFRSGALTLIRYGWQRLRHGQGELSADAIYFNLVWDNLQMRRQIDQADKRIAALTAGHKRIRASMLPYFDQSINTSEWLRPNLVGILGTGLSQATIDKIQKRPPEQYEKHKPFLAVLQGEAAFLNGSYRRSAELLKQALQSLPKQEALLCLRTETRLAMALLKCGQEAEALPLLKHVISQNGAMLREVGARLPVKLQIETTLQGKDFNEELIQGLRRSPRFQVGSSGLVLLVTSASPNSLRVAVSDESGNSFKSYNVTLRSSSTPLAEIALAGIHDGLCTPSINLSGLDDSIDGSNTSIGVRELIKYK